MLLATLFRNCRYSCTKNFIFFQFDESNNQKLKQLLGFYQLICEILGFFNVNLRSTWKNKKQEVYVREEIIEIKWNTATKAIITVFYNEFRWEFVLIEVIKDYIFINFFKRCKLICYLILTVFFFSLTQHTSIKILQDKFLQFFLFVHLPRKYWKFSWAL